MLLASVGSALKTKRGARMVLPYVPTVFVKFSVAPFGRFARAGFADATVMKPPATGGLILIVFVPELNRRFAVIVSFVPTRARTSKVPALKVTGTAAVIRVV